MIIVREAIRLFNEELEKFYSDSVPYKHVSIDKDEIVKSIIKTLGDKKEMSNNEKIQN